MNKILAFSASLLLTSATSWAQTVLEEHFETQEDFARWTVVDANSDEKTWVFDASGDPTHVYSQYHSTNTADDWIFSPEVQIAEPGSYLVTFLTRGSSYGENLELWTGTAASTDAMTAKQAEWLNMPLENLNKSALVTVDRSGALVLGFHAVSPADGWRIYLGDIVMRKVENPSDLAVTSVLSPLSGENLGEEPVAVLLKNAGSTPISGFKISYTLALAKDASQVISSATEEVELPDALKPGEEMTYTFAAKADLSTPRTGYSLEVSVECTDDINGDNDKIEVDVRHLAPATVPYFMGFEAEEDTDGISFINANNDDGYWSIQTASFFMNLARTGYKCVGYNYNKQNNADDWFFLDPFQLEKGYYALKFWYCATKSHPERLRVCYGDAPTAEAMTNVIVEYNPMLNDSYEESINIFSLPADGKYYIGFYAFSDKDENWILIDDISLEKVDPDMADLEILDVKEPFDFWRSPDTKNATVNVRNIGLNDITADLVISVDGEELRREPVTVKAMEEKDVVIEDVISAIPQGKHAMLFSIDYPSDSHPGNNTFEKSVTVITDAAAALWDFENSEDVGTDGMPHYALPSDLTFRSEDSYTVNPDAGSEFEENGWGIFSLKHYMFGEKALAGCSWFTSPGTADRWVVLPQMEVEGEDAWFAFDAVSYNPNMLEDYRVKVSAGEDIWSDYNTLLSIDGETVSPKTRGISLAEYVGKKVFIAINLRTYDGEALILDNLGVYGSVRRTDGSGVAGVVDSEGRLVRAGNMLVASCEGVASIEVYDMAGARVAMTSGKTLSIESLPAGIYMARAMTSEGKAMLLKFAR